MTQPAKEGENMKENPPRTPVLQDNRIARNTYTQTKIMKNVHPHIDNGKKHMGTINTLSLGKFISTAKPKQNTT